jgi:hypothetical protein
MVRTTIIMIGIQFATDEKGRKVAVQIDLQKHGARLADFWDRLISESRRNENGIPFEKSKRTSRPYTSAAGVQEVKRVPGSVARSGRRLARGVHH